MRTECKLMHIDRADEITMAREPASAAGPISAFGLLFMPASGTLATCSSFGAGEARDVSLFRFVGEIVDILAILPQRHALIVVSAVLSIADTMRIADEECSHLLLDTKVDNLSCGLMTHSSDTTKRATRDLVLGALQPLPATGMFLAAGLFLSDFAKLLVALPLEGTDPPPGDDQGVPGIRRDSPKMDFAQIDRRLFLARSFFSLWGFYAHMQFKATVPDQVTGTAIFRKLDGQDEGCASFPHWQDHTSLFLAHRLSRPLNRIEPLRAPGVLHVHLWVLFAQLAGRVDVGEEGTEDRLNRLAMQRKTALGGLMQLMATRPMGMGHPCLLVGFHAEVPDLGCFHLSRLQAAKQGRGKMRKPVDTHGLHGCSLAFLISFDMRFHRGQNLSIQRAVMSFGNLFHLFQDVNRKADRERFRFFFFRTHASILQQEWMQVKGGSLSSRPLERGGSFRSP